MKKRLEGILLALAMTLTLLPWATTGTQAEAAPVAYTAYTADGGSDGCWGDGAPAYLVDNNTQTKWGADHEGTKYVEFHSKVPISPVGYILTTGRDTQDNPHRNPRSWNVYARNEGDTKWTLLDAVTDSDKPEAVNLVPYTFMLKNPDTSKTWQYFRYEVTASQYVQNQPTTHVQLAEFQFLIPNSGTAGLSEGQLYVGGVDLVAAAGHSVDGTNGGSAVLSIRDGKPVLTLANYSYEGTGHISDGNCYSAIYYDGEPTLTIELSGTNSMYQTCVKSGTPRNRGIWCASGLNITGGGKLTITLGVSDECHGIHTGGALTVSGADLEIECGRANNGSCFGIRSNGVRIVDKSKVTATCDWANSGNSYTVFSETSAGAAVYIRDSEVWAQAAEAPADNAMSCGIYGSCTASGSDTVNAAGVEIINSTVSAYGGTWGINSYGIYGSCSINAESGCAWGVRIDGGSVGGLGGMLVERSCGVFGSGTANAPAGSTSSTASAMGIEVTGSLMSGTGGDTQYNDCFGIYGTANGCGDSWGVRINNSKVSGITHAGKTTIGLYCSARSSRGTAWGVWFDGGELECSGKTMYPVDDKPDEIGLCSIGVYAQEGGIWIGGGTVNAKGDKADDSCGIRADGGTGAPVRICRGAGLYASGLGSAIYGSVINEAAGTGWTDPEGKEGKAGIAASSVGKSLTAFKRVEFQPKECAVSAAVNGGKGGTVSGAGTFRKGKTVTLTATPDAGYVFDHWKRADGTTSTDKSLAFMVTEDETVTAYFAAYSVAGGKVCAPGGALLILAQYQNGRMSAVRSVKLAADCANVDAKTLLGIGAYPDGSKLMLVNGKTYAPLCAAWSS